MTAERSRRRGWIAVASCLGGLVALVVVVGLLLGFGGGARAPNLGRFAGYLWSGRIAGIGASWDVPAIAARSSPGQASTWIGAQGSGSSARYPFIQVGVEERRTTDPTLGPRTFYDAFWSDTNHDFYPVTLFSVDAGDRITARLIRQQHRWLITIVDASSHTQRRLITRDQGEAKVNTAEWLQEDTATSPAGTKAFPYPATTPVRFSQLSVNSRAPRSADLYSEWMSLQTRDLAPTALSQDGFTIARATLSHAAARFIALASREDTAMTQFAQRSGTWTPATHQATVSAAVSRLVTTLKINRRALATSDWPPGARGPLNALAQLVAALITQANAMPPLPAAERDKRLAAFDRIGRRGADLAHKIRLALHAPGINPEPAA